MTEMMINVLVSALILIGCIFILVGAIGIVRFPDLYCRLHAATKGPTLGIISIMLASILGFYFFYNFFSSDNFLAVIFVLLTAPVGSHMIAKAGYNYSVKLWSGSTHDEWGINKDLSD